MFRLKLYDILGQELHIGDIVRIRGNYEVTFFCKVEYDKERGILHPFHTFSFHRVAKIDKLPEGVIETKDNGRTYWYFREKQNENQVPNKSDRVMEYLVSWRECESNLKTYMYRIELEE